MKGKTPVGPGKKEQRPVGFAVDKALARQGL
jgi:hypothetical protein